MVQVYPFPAGEIEASTHRVLLNGRSVRAHACTVSAMPFNTVMPFGFNAQRDRSQTEEAAFISFNLDGCEPANMEVGIDEPITEAVVRPLSRGIRVVNHEPAAHCVTFRIDQPGQYTVELNGHHHALHLFVNRPEAERPRMSAGKLMYFGPGVHDVGRVELKDGQSVYLDEGAVVYGAFHADGQKHISISGHGILDNSRCERLGFSCIGQPSAIVLYRCSNIEVSGIVIRDSCCFCLTCVECENLTVDNVKLIGMWRSNSDGIDLINSSNCIIRGCFLRTYDDAMVLKGWRPHDRRNVENILVQNCVIWCDWGRALELGLETCADEFRGIVMENMDIIHTCHVAIDVQNGDHGTIHQTAFRDIRVEYSRHMRQLEYQMSPDMRYEPADEPYAAPLIVVEVCRNHFSTEGQYGHNRDITFRDIQVLLDEGVPEPRSRVEGADEAHLCENIAIQNLSFNGVRCLSPADARLTTNRYAVGVTVE